MGWGRMLLLGNWGQQMDIDDLQQEIEELKMEINDGVGPKDTSTLKTRIVTLEKENGELRLYLAALVRYLGRKGILSQSDFRAIVEAVDREDGQADGSYKGKIMG